MWTIEVQRGITGKAALRSFDCVVLTTDHDQFDYEWIADKATSEMWCKFSSWSVSRFYAA